LGAIVVEGMEIMEKKSPSFCVILDNPRIQSGIWTQWKLNRVPLEQKAPLGRAKLPFMGVV